jgi:hypothetical protein
MLFIELSMTVNLLILWFLLIILQTLNAEITNENPQWRFSENGQ